MSNLAKLKTNENFKLKYIYVCLNNPDIWITNRLKINHEMNNNFSDKDFGSA